MTDTNMKGIAINSSISKTMDEIKSLNPSLRVELDPTHIPKQFPDCLEPREDNQPDKNNNNKDSRDSRDGGGGKKKGKQGMNKKRPRDQRIDRTTLLCRALVRGEDCTFEDCKYSHDVEGFMKNRPKDIGER